MKGQTGCLGLRLPFPNCAMLPTAIWTMSEKRIYRGALKIKRDSLFYVEFCKEQLLIASSNFI
jgi:hypothetical protein